MRIYDSKGATELLVESVSNSTLGQGDVFKKVFSEPSSHGNSGYPRDNSEIAQSIRMVLWT